MSIEQIAQIATICTSVLTGLAILIVGLAVFIRLIIKARKPESDGGKKITPEEWQQIIIAVLPFAAKILKLYSDRVDAEEAANEAVAKREQEEAKKNEN